MRWIILGLLASCLLCPLRARAYTNLDAAYRALGFEPDAPGSAVVVFFSDPHMCRDPGPLVDHAALVTNLDARLVQTVNAMHPPPARILVAGDVSTSLSLVPGWIPRAYSFERGTNEMRDWLAAIGAFTNLDRSQILWVPGNHDQTPQESNAETFCRIFPGMPPYQSFDLAGIRFFLLNGGNGGEPSPEEQRWLRRQVATTSPSQPVAVVIHQQPFYGITVERGNALLLREVFGDWQAPWWIFCGHGHTRDCAVFNVGRSNVAQVAVGTANTNVFNGLTHHAGFLMLCLRQGRVGMIYYHFDTAEFEVMPQPAWAHPKSYVAAFEQVPGLLWRQFKTPVASPEVRAAEALDAGYWWSNPVHLEWDLALRHDDERATHFLLLSSGLDPTVRVGFSADRTNWLVPPLPKPTNAVYSCPIPPQLGHSSTIHVRLCATNGVNQIGGWGLASTTSSQRKH